MSKIEHDVTFATGRVELDGRVFVNCAFQKVRLAYIGRDITALWNCTFPEKDSLEFELGDLELLEGAHQFFELLEIDFHGAGNIAPGRRNGRLYPAFTESEEVP